MVVMSQSMSTGTDEPASTVKDALNKQANTEGVWNGEFEPQQSMFMCIDLSIIQPSNQMLLLL